jgi:hypothetical protein
MEQHHQIAGYSFVNVYKYLQTDNSSEIEIIRTDMIINGLEKSNVGFTCEIDVTELPLY